MTLQGEPSAQRHDADPEHRSSPDVRLYTPAEAAAMLQVRESWLRKKASARAIPCTFVGKHLRFSDQDIAGIIAAGAKQPVVRSRRARR
ncbi:helix-turn-helix domain-containing protein [Actinomadura sp. NPDC023710]|uniref:helix-turn-helix domain-containing protein n=1 Tax=Actinomadura sp. NPDC023710 TaxID=3158219 RepID=UPI0033FB36F1